jgi:hypothetical protein
MKIVYKPFSVLVAMVAEAVATNVWRRLWRLLAHEAKPPKATDRDTNWPEIVVASAMRGAVYAVVRAVIKRSGATAFANVTGTWPGRQSAESGTQKR